METVEVIKGLKDGGTIIINTKKSPSDFKFSGKFRILTIDASKIAREELGSPIANTAMLGALAAATDLVDLNCLLQAVDKGMPAELREKNKKAIERTYYLMRKGEKNG